IIQSSQPSSLKLTCRGLRLQRVLAFLPCPFPPDLAARVVLRLLLGWAGAVWPGSGGSEKGGLSFLWAGWSPARSLTASQTSKTSQRGEPESRRSAARESHSRGGWAGSGQAVSRSRCTAPSRDRAKLRFSGRRRRIRRSAPTTSSAGGRLERSKRYRWPASAGAASGEREQRETEAQPGYGAPRAGKGA
uniref:Uncharacterized protein n=1 Tax=Pelusios castaneus TaxID=367368 RepID=A0A8C8RTB5_9SAUR